MTEIDFSIRIFYKFSYCIFFSSLIFTPIEAKMYKINTVIILNFKKKFTEFYMG